MAAEFEIYYDADDCYRWRLIASDDSVVANGGPYDTHAEAVWEARAVRAAAAGTEGFESDARHEPVTTWPTQRRTA